MQIQIHASPHNEASSALADHLASVLKDALGRFGERITRVEAHMSDANGPAKTGEGDDIECMLQAHLVGLDAVVVKEQAGNPHQAIAGAVRKLKRAVGVALGKRDPRHQAAQAAQA
jgi:ribosome-associated translation inhibitor RaiA